MHRQVRHEHRSTTSLELKRRLHHGRRRALKRSDCAAHGRRPRRDFTFRDQGCRGHLSGVVRRSPTVCGETGIGEDVGFATRPQLARKTRRCQRPTKPTTSSGKPEVLHTIGETSPPGPAAVFYQRAPSPWQLMSALRNNRPVLLRVWADTTLAAKNFSKPLTRSPKLRRHDQPPVRLRFGRNRARVLRGGKAPVRRGHGRADSETGGAGARRRWRAPGRSCVSRDAHYLRLR
jgi:hypothetical protein